MTSSARDDSTFATPLLQDQSDVASGSSTGAKHQKCNYEITIDIGDKPCIYRVPIGLREINAAAYTPQVILIGPLHRDLRKNIYCQVLPAMKPHRQRYLDQFCKEAAEANGLSIDVQKQKFMEKINAQAEDIKSCYDETMDLSDAAFSLAEMILFDAAFIIQLFRRRQDVIQGDSDHKGDFLIYNPWMSSAIQQDLMLLENQLPYFILVDLYKSAFPKADTNFFDLTFHYFESYTDPDERNKNLKTKKSVCRNCFAFLYGSAYFSPKASTKLEKDECSCQKPKHFTDFVRKERFKWKVLVSCPKRDNKSNYRPFPATKLDKAGVQFNVSTDDWQLSVTFEKGELTMPPFIVDDSTECLFRNLMAFEQLHYPSDAYFCNYIRFLNCLIDTPEDVDLLVEKRVINHRLGNNAELSKLVNDLDKEMGDIDNRYAAILAALEEHYENGWIRWVAFIRQVYFTNFWKGTTTIAAFIFLIINLTTSIISCIKSF